MTEAANYTPPMMAYVAEMFAEMRANEAKDSWKGLGVYWALEEVHYHVAKLHWAIRHVSDDPTKYLDQIREYSADIGNICMMLADEAGVLRYQADISRVIPPFNTNWTRVTFAEKEGDVDQEPKHIAEPQQPNKDEKHTTEKGY